MRSVTWLALDRVFVIQIAGLTRGRADPCLPPSIAAMLLARNSEQDGGTASIAVEPARIDYGLVKFGESRQVANTGDGTLRFRNRLTLKFWRAADLLS